MHAGVIASKYKRGSETFYAKFREFVRCLEDSDYDEDYSGEKAVTRAYQAFHLCAQTDIMKVDGVAEDV
jgi:hypothetical protein